jgi:fructose-1,6-bisphosphatase/inositol monophosphatase family enzyme
MSHVGLGITEAYWEYRLKPWDMAAGVLVVTFSPKEILTFNITFPNQFYK